MNTMPTQFSATIKPVTDDSIDDLGRKWRSLESRVDVPFSLSWCWIGAWLPMARAETDVFVFECRNDDDVVAMCFVTLCEARRLKGHLSVKQLQINEYRSEELNMAIAYNGLLGEPQHLDAAWDCFFRTASHWSRRWDEIALNSLVDTQYEIVENHLNGLNLEIDRIDKAWKIAFDSEVASIDELLRFFKQKSRQQLRQTLQAYRELGELKVKAAEDAGQALAMFKNMEELHTKRWEKVGKSGCYANAYWVDFHTGIIQHCFDTGHVQVLEISCAEKPIGYLYGHIYRNKVYMQQTGFVQTSSAKYRPGYISHCMAMLLNLYKGNLHYDFLPDGQDSYKRFFAPEGGSVYYARAARPRVKFRLERALRNMVASISRLNQTTPSPRQHPENTLGHAKLRTRQAER